MLLLTNTASNNFLKILHVDVVFTLTICVII